MMSGIFGAGKQRAVLSAKKSGLKIRFVEPGNRPYKPHIFNYFVYDRFIRTPSVGLNTLATIVKKAYPDTFMYSEAISLLRMEDILDADIIFIGFFTYAAVRGYELADYFSAHSKAAIVLGGLHASMNYEEAVGHGDYVMLGEGDETILPLIKAIQNGTRPDFPGLAWQENGSVKTTGKAPPVSDFNLVPDRALIHNYKKMVGHYTVWPQVHASRGCPHNCDYCALVRHFGRAVRTRTPENVLEDIRYTISFFGKGRRLFKNLWLTDDNFFADREWAKSVLQLIIDTKLDYRFNVQARYETGFDDEMLELLKKAGFFELAFGIEFIDDESFATYHKKSTRDEIIAAIKNTRRHGISVRGLFILGSDNQKKGCGKQLADFVIANHIQGVLVQCMYFVPGTPVFEASADRLLHRDWSKYNGNTVHYPQQMTPYELQLEHIDASRRIYSPIRLFKALLFEDMIHKVLFAGEFFWHWSIRSDLKKELPALKKRSFYHRAYAGRLEDFKKMGSLVTELSEKAACGWSADKLFAWQEGLWNENDPAAAVAADFEKQAQLWFNYDDELAGFAITEAPGGPYQLLTGEAQVYREMLAWLSANSKRIFQREK